MIKLSNLISRALTFQHFPIVLDSSTLDALQNKGSPNLSTFSHRLGVGIGALLSWDAIPFSFEKFWLSHPSPSNDMIKNHWNILLMRSLHIYIPHTTYTLLQMQKSQTTAPTPSFAIDKGPYVSVLEDGMVTAVGDEEQTDDSVQDLAIEQTENVSPNDTDKEKADHFRKNDQSERYQENNTTHVTTPIRKCIDSLSRQSGKSIWLLAYIAIVTTWPMVRPALSLLFRKRYKNASPGGSRKR